MSAQLGTIDHVVINAGDFERTLSFYERVFNATRDDSPYLLDGRVEVQRLRAGQFVLSVHRAGSAARPIAAHPQVGGADICFCWTGRIEDAEAHVVQCGIEIELGPVGRRAFDGAEAWSIYFRDPDGNLLELLARKA